MNKKRRQSARKSKIKTKKPKFLSLRLQFPANETGKTKLLSEMLPASAANQLNLFPLHPENQVLEVDPENVDYFFSSVDGSATSLNGLLDASTTTPCNSSHATNNVSSRPDDLSPSSASLTYAFGGHESESGEAFVRNAMRNRERDSSEEKWVFYSEVVERKVKEEEVTSSAVDIRQSEIKRLSLKLDYQEILNAWSDKGPLHIHGDNSQIVPDVNDDFFSHEASNNGCNAGLWTVPKMVGDIKNGEIRINNGNELKMGQRLASVLRYKQKRQNRLFSKKIRYEVRKLNAQKRPRLKGRFVKRS